MSVPPDFSPEVDAFCEVLRIGGLAVALDFLNERTGYRFTFIYKCELPYARRVFVYDRASLYISSRDLVPVSQTFFELMLTEPVFATADGLHDERTCQHPGRTHFRGFCGVQLRHDDGRLYGWLAHAHPGAMEVPPQEAAFLQRVGTPLMQLLQVCCPGVGLESRLV